ncbi:MAG TPA: hypothetical protein VI953_00355 [Candidatus Paceibacterota bacterium]
MRRLKRTLTTLSNSGETLDKCISRLGSKYGTKSLTMMICLETGSNQESVVEATYVPEFKACEGIALRPGIRELLGLGVTTEILTNAPEAWARYVLTYYGIADRVSKICGLGTGFLYQKPEDAEVFQQIEGGDIVYVDDIFANCVEAHKLGWNAFWFPEEDSYHLGEGLGDTRDRSIKRIHTAIEAMRSGG